MLRQRRSNNLLAESLGPPVRLLCAENGEKVEEKSSHRSASSRKPPLSSNSMSRAAISHGKENRYQCATPRETPAPSNNSNRQTPNSTYPNSMCGGSGSISKSSVVSLAGGQRTPSSTFPVSLPITGAPDTQRDTGITEPDAFPAPEPTDKAVNTEVRTIPSDEPGTEEIKTVDRISKIVDVDVNLRRGSDDRGTPAPAATTTTTTTTNTAAATNPPPPPSLPPAPPPTSSQPGMTPAASTNGQPLSQGTALAGDIVVMASNAGERRFKRLELIGCGGSSKVRGGRKATHII
jgi:hypothetical protein